MNIFLNITNYILSFITVRVGLVFISLRLEIFCCFIVSEKKEKTFIRFYFLEL